MLEIVTSGGVVAIFYPDFDGFGDDDCRGKIWVIGNKEIIPADLKTR